MTPLPPFRRLLRVFHPEGIPGLGTWFYNWISSIDIFQRNYNLVAEDIVRFCAQGSVLDVGTGPGWLLLRLYHRSPTLRLLGVDLSPSMVSKARANIGNVHLTDHIQVREASACALPFSDATFDVVVSTGSFHHWKEPVAGLNEIYRVLAPGGRALIYDIIADIPSSVYDHSAKEFGRLRTMLLWIHSYEEPFYRERDLVPFAQSSHFQQGTTRYVGVLCCLEMQKTNGTPFATKK